MAQRTIAPTKWLGVFWLCFAACLAVAVLVIVMAPRLARFGLTGYLVYVVFIPLGLGAAGFLSGAMRVARPLRGQVLVWRPARRRPAGDLRGGSRRRRIG
jgi:hypothetical protein